MPEENRLPPLRQDLELKQLEPDDDGMPVWMIHDKVRHSYFKIGWLELEILSRWILGSAKAIAQSVNEETTLTISERNIELVEQFLQTNDLLIGAGDHEPERLLNKIPPAINVKQILQKYLFLIIPLFNPDWFLRKTLPVVRLLFTKTAFIIFAFFAIAGFYLMSHQFDQFIHTFDYIFSLKNMVSFVIAIIFVKVIHELAHGYVATYFGCRVNAMGIAFLVMWPILFTDTTDAWKLSSRHQRIAIAAAGMMAELMMAALATFIWNFLPDGPLRTITFFIAAISWLSSLFVNLNPMLRFDGYYLFSDIIGVSNLQQHGFGLAKWRLRELLFKFNDRKPYYFSKPKEIGLLIYAYCTWIYRFFLFLSIAIIVYFFFFKALGIILMIIELFFFLMLPIWRELHNYWIRRHRVKMNKNTIITFISLGVLIALFFIPWQTRISAPAALEFSKQTKIFTQRPGRLEKLLIIQGEHVNKGQLLAVFSNPDLNYQRHQTKLDIDIIQTRLRQELEKSKELGHQQASREELSKKTNEYRNLAEEEAKLKIYAPFTGEITSVDKTIEPNTWLGKDVFLAELVKTSPQIIYAYVSEKDLHRISPSNKAVFYPDTVDKKRIRAKVISSDKAATEILSSPYQASVYGGEIAVFPKEDGTMHAKDAVYRVHLENLKPIKNLTHIMRGHVVIKGKRESYAYRIWRLIASVFVRESGF